MAAACALIVLSAWPTTAEANTEPTRIEISPGRHDFGDVAVGAFRDQTFTVTNVGATTPTLTTETIDSVFAIVDDDCDGGSLPPATGCQVVLRFAPVVEGDQGDALIVRSDNDAFAASVVGRGTTAAPSTTAATTTTEPPLTTPPITTPPTTTPPTTTPPPNTPPTNTPPPATGPLTTPPLATGPPTSAGPVDTGSPGPTDPVDTTSSTLAPPTTQAPVDETDIERCERIADQARVEYQPDQTMEVGVPSDVLIGVGSPESPGSILPPSSDAPSVEPADLTCNFEGRLDGAGFDIAGLNPQPGSFAIDPEDPIVWRWVVTPTRPGPGKLILTIVTKVGGSARTVGLFEASIDVQAAPRSGADRTTDFFQTVVDYPLVRGFGALVGVGGALFAVIRWLQRRPTGHETQDQPSSD